VRKAWKRPQLTATEGVRFGDHREIVVRLVAISETMWNLEQSSVGDMPFTKPTDIRWVTMTVLVLLAVRFVVHALMRRYSKVRSHRTPRV
jgi:hypothetical protein